MDSNDDTTRADFLLVVVVLVYDWLHQKSSFRRGVYVFEEIPIVVRSGSFSCVPVGLRQQQLPTRECCRIGCDHDSGPCEYGDADSDRNQRQEQRRGDVDSKRG